MSVSLTVYSVDSFIAAYRLFTS